MFDKELIERVCNLSITKKDVCINQEAINYDYEYPFHKYYNVNTIIGAINKYLYKEWDAETLAHWCCIYNWILCGGFHDELKEDLTSLEQFIFDVISWDLDGLSFFDEDYLEEGISEIYKWIEMYKAWDYILQTRDNWKAMYAMVGENAEFNEDQFVVLINDITKEYMIIHSNHLENGFEDEFFKYIKENEFISLIEKLNKGEYKIISCSEEWYYSEISGWEE
jgi:hypothetical protein